MMMLRSGIIPTAGFLCFSFLLLLYTFVFGGLEAGLRSPSSSSKFRTTLVISQCCDQNLDWVDRSFRDVNKIIYSVDGAIRSKSPHRNLRSKKSVEAIAFVQYVLQHYDRLPDVVVFAPAKKPALYQHDLLGFLTSAIVARLNLAHVVTQRFQPLRCEHAPGCDNETWIDLDPRVDFPPAFDLDTTSPLIHTRAHDRALFGKAWSELFGPDAPRLPLRLAAPVYGGFAVTRPAIRRTTRAQWERYRKWMEDTNLPDHSVSMVFAFLWQYLFLGESEFCPDEFTCACEGFAICFANRTVFEDWREMRDTQRAMHMEMVELGKTKKGAKTIAYKNLSYRLQTIGVEIQRLLDDAKARVEYGSKGLRLYLPFGAL